MFVVDSATQLHFQVRMVLEFQFGVCCSCAPQEASTASYVVCSKVTWGSKAHSTGHIEHILRKWFIEINFKFMYAISEVLKVRYLWSSVFILLQLFTFAQSGPIQADRLFCAISPATRTNPLTSDQPPQHPKCRRILAT
jgi:hypothetical protein